MKIKVYSTPGCSYCSKLKQLFERANITEYDEQLCNNGDELRVDYPEASSFPYVIMDGKEIGGLVETAKFFVEKNLVSSNKK